MANYSILIDWQAKDSLPDTDVNKIISGQDFFDEFETIKNSIQTKAELLGDVNNAFSTIKAVDASDQALAASTSWVRAFNIREYVTRTNGSGLRTISTSDASGGANGDIHYKVS